MKLHPATVLTACMLLLALAAPTFAADTVAYVQAASGEALIEPPDGTSRPAAPEAEVLAMETIVTGPDGSLQIMFLDRTMLALGPNSRLAVLDAMDEDGDGSLALDLITGTARVLTGELMRQNPEQFHMSTPLGLIGIRGTEFGSLAEGDREVHLLYEGGPVVYTDTQPETAGPKHAELCAAIADAQIKTDKAIKKADGPLFISKRTRLKKNRTRLEQYRHQYRCP